MNWLLPGYSRVQKYGEKFTVEFTVSANCIFRYIFRPLAATRLVLLVQFCMVIIDHSVGNQLSGFPIWLGKFYMVEYCEFFKFAFAKILYFQRRLKTRSEAPTISGPLGITND